MLVRIKRREECLHLVGIAHLCRDVEEYLLLFGIVDIAVDVLREPFWMAAELLMQALGGLERHVLRQEERELLDRHGERRGSRLNRAQAANAGWVQGAQRFGIVLRSQVDDVLEEGEAVDTLW